MPYVYTRIHKVRPNGMPPESFNRLIFFLAIIVGLLMLHIISGGAGNIQNLLIRLIVVIPVILISLSFHEFSHAAMADFLGDPTPRRSGRLTLNPLKHLDIVGSILILFTNFGWAKPVVVDPRYFRVPQRAMVSVAIAGPLSNVILAIVGVLIMRLFSMVVHQVGSPFLILLVLIFLQMLVIINLSLALFNLLPIPPLDGSRIVSYLLPAKHQFQYQQFAAIAPLVLMLLFFVGALGVVFSPIITVSFNYLMAVAGNPQNIIRQFLITQNLPMT